MRRPLLAACAQSKCFWCLQEDSWLQVKSSEARFSKTLCTTQMLNSLS